MEKIKLGVLVSGGGSNLQAIIDACEKGVLQDAAEVALVISSNPDAFALERARNHAVEALYMGRKTYADAAHYCDAMVSQLRQRNVDLVCLAGYMQMLEPNFIAAFRGNIINIHPALLPKFGGKGMYGHHVHEAVVAAGEKTSGATVHYVDEEYDHGETILQAAVPVRAGDSAETLAKRVLEMEHLLYPRAILQIITSRKQSVEAQ